MSKSAFSLSNEKIRDLEATLLSNLDEQLFFKNLGHIVKENFSCDRVIIFKSMDDGASVFIADTSASDTSPYIQEKGRGVSGHVIRTFRPYYSNDSTRDPLFAGVKESEGYLSELCIPVVVAGQVMATIHLQNKTNETPFGQEHINGVVEFLALLERPLHNMKMYLTAKHLNEALKEEIQKKDKKLQEQIQGVKNSLYHVQDFKLIGNSPEINGIRNIISKLSETKVPILIEGRSGVGKEAIAKKIHIESCGEDRPFVVANSSILTEENFEKEMFGHVKGAFFGSNIKKVGLCELANGGTLFIDNVGELSPSMQVKILRFLRTRKIYKIGSQNETEVNVRVIASFNGNLKREVSNGRFREDLYFMLKGFSINIPALKDRKDDIGPLANFFLNREKSAMDHRQLSVEALNTLKGYSWPGNVRELRNAMERSYLMSEGKTIGIDHLPGDILGEKDSEKEDKYVEMTLQKLEEKHILKTLEFSKGNKTRTAKVLGITVKTLYNKLHSYGAIRPREAATPQVERKV